VVTKENDMTDIYNALLAAGKSLAKGELADLVVCLSEELRREPEGERARIVNAIAALLYPTPLLASVAKVAVTSAGRKPKSPLFIREVLEYDPTVFNGYSICKGSFLNGIASYTGSNLLCFGTRGTGDKLLMFGKRKAGMRHTFVYPSGSIGTIEDFECEASLNSWKEAHAFLESKGVPQGKAMPFGKAIAK
jgi:hypothetical protein